MKKVKLSSYPSQLSSIQVLYHTVPARSSEGVEDSYLNPPVNTFIALRCMEARRPVDIVLIQIYFYKRYTKRAIMTLFEVGTSRHWCVSRSVTFTFYHQEVSGVLTLRPNKWNKIVVMGIFASQSMCHYPRVYNQLKNVKQIYEFS